MFSVEENIDNVKNYKIITNGDGEVGVVYFKFKKGLIEDLLFYAVDRDELKADLSECVPHKYYKFISWEGYTGIEQVSLDDIKSAVDRYTGDGFCFVSH